MGFGAEVVMALVGLWGLFLRPIMFRHATQMVEVMGYAILQIVRGRRPSWVLPS